MSQVDGHCLCGAVSFTATPKAGSHICHCGHCRKWSGGMFIGVGLTEAPEFADQAVLGIYRSSDWGERLFCRICGSSILFRTLDGAHHVASIQCFDEPAQFLLEGEIFVDSKPLSYAITGDHPRMTGAEFLAMVSPQQEH